MTGPFALESASLFDPAVVDFLSREDPMAIHKLRAFASPRSDCDESIIDIKELRRRCLLDQNSTSSGSSAPHWKETVSSRPLPPSSRLESLPVETLRAVFAPLNLQSLTNLRSVNRRAMSIVDSLPLYRELYTRCPDVLRVMLSTRLARHYNLWHLSQELHLEDCYYCGQFGAFLYLPAVYAAVGSASHSPNTPSP